MDNGDCESLKEALRAAGTIWGGIRSPILVVNDRRIVNPRCEQIADCIGFDAVVDVRSDTSSPLQFTDGPRNVPTDPIRRLDEGQFWSAHALVALPNADRIDFNVFSGNPENLTELAGAGCVATPDEHHWWAESVGGFKSNCTAVELLLAQSSGQSLLEVAARQDSDHEVSNLILQSATFVAVARDDEDFGTAVAFWNLRALRPRTSMSGRSVLLRLADAHSEGVAEELAQAAVYSATTPRMVLLSDALAVEELWQLVEHWGFDRYEDTEISEHFLSSTPVDGPISVGMFDPGYQWLAPRVSGRFIQHEVTWTRPTTAITVDSPVVWNSHLMWRGTVCLTADGEQFNVPRTAKTAQLYEPRAVWDLGGLRILTNPIRRYDYSLRLPTPGEILSAVLEERGFSLTNSDKAIQIGGVLSATRSRSLFRNAGIVSTVRALTGTSRRDLLRRLQTNPLVKSDDVGRLMAAISPPTGLRFDDVVERTKGTDKDAASKALERLVREGFVERGFQTKCPACGLKLFADLLAASGTPKCSGCGSAAELVTHRYSEPLVHYRLGSLLNTVSLNGGLAPLAAVCALLEEDAYVVPGVNLTFEDADCGEVDLIGWKERSVFAGEAKMSAAGFDSHDFERDLKRVRSLGADEYVVVCLESIEEQKLDDWKAQADAAGLAMRFLGPKELLIS